MRRRHAQVESIEPCLHVRRTPLPIEIQSRPKRFPLKLIQAAGTSRRLTQATSPERRVVLKRIVPRQKDICDTGQRIHVVADIRSLALEDLAAREPRRRDCDLLLVVKLRYPRAAVQLMRGAEVQNPNFAVVGDENISRIEIAMHDAPGVSMRDRGSDVPNDGQRIRAVQSRRFLRGQHAAQQCAAQVLHGEEG